MAKAVIFDLDGTLLDTLKDIAYYVNETLEYFGHEKRTNDEIMQFIGNGARMLVKRSLPKHVSEQEVDACLKYYNEIYTNSGSPRTCLFPRVREVLLTLKQRGYKIAILTNKPQKTTDEVYNKYMFDLGFDMVVGQRANVKVKPDPTEALRIAKELGASPNEVYFVGDGETDVEVANNAQMNGVAVLWGYRRKDQLQKAGASIFVSTPDQLLEIIK